MTKSHATRSRLVSKLALVLALAAPVSATRADDTGPRGPPPDPSAACSGQQAGSACSVTFGDRAVQGTCESAPDGRLGCRPGAPPSPRAPSPPSEAFTACKSRKSGDGCSVAFGPLTMTGSCAAVEDGRLACRPGDPPRDR